MVDQWGYCSVHQAYVGSGTCWKCSTTPMPPNPNPNVQLGPLPPDEQRIREIVREEIERAMRRGMR